MEFTQKKRNLSPMTKISKKSNNIISSNEINELSEGMNVRHQIFGIGKIKKIDIHSNQKKAIINFKNVGEKTLLLNFAKLKVLK